MLFNNNLGFVLITKERRWNTLTVFLQQSTRKYIMAYATKALKEKIAAELKKVVPSDWKYSLAGANSSTITLTVKSANTDLIKRYLGEEFDGQEYYNLNHYWYEQHCQDAELKAVLEKIIAALNTDNYDHSDIMTDYFCVGHYISVNFGRWDKPFVTKG